MKKYCLSALIVLTSVSYSLAQSDRPCPCCSEDHKAFDFWVGNWTVYNNGGGVIGTNKVVKMIDGCVLQENWVASNKTNTGTSYNFFDSTDSTWNQVWISNTGNVLRLKGHIDIEGAMVLKSELVNGPKGNYYNQITWSQNDDGSVTQQWDILTESNQPLSKAFEGIYKKTDYD
jgi:hypothetical protein